MEAPCDERLGSGEAAAQCAKQRLSAIGKGAFGQSQGRLSSAVQESMVLQRLAYLLSEIDVDPVAKFWKKLWS